MRQKLLFTAAGFVLGMVFLAGITGVALFAGARIRPTMTVHETRTPTGKAIKVTACMLVWGVGHTDAERDEHEDQFQLEFVSAVPGAAAAVREQELRDAFELIRPLSEQWGFTRATLLVFPTVVRKGAYDIYNYERDAAGNWSRERHSAKVHIND